MMELFKYNNKEHLIELARRIRQEPLNNTEYMMEFFDDFFMKANAAKLYVNACLQNMFDAFKVSRKRSIREKLFFTT